MKRNLIKIGCASVLIVAVIVALISCNKETVVKENVQNIEQIVSNSKQFENPYDIYGQIHNEAMEIILKKTESGIAFDLSKFSCEYIAEKLSKMTNYEYSFWFQNFTQAMPLFESTYLPNCLSEEPINFSNSIYSALTFNQRKYLQKLFDDIEIAQSRDELLKNILVTEKEALKNASFTDEDKLVVLGTIAIAKYSYQFYIKNFHCLDKGKFLDKVKKVAKADAGGFVTGAVGSVVSGHAQAATLVFGPQGTVAVIAGEATIGAVVGSGLAVAHEVGCEIIHH